MSQTTMSALEFQTNATAYPINLELKIFLYCKNAKQFHFPTELQPTAS